MPPIWFYFSLPGKLRSLHPRACYTHFPMAAQFAANYWDDACGCAFLLAFGCSSLTFVITCVVCPAVVAVHFTGKGQYCLKVDIFLHSAREILLLIYQYDGFQCSGKLEKGDKNERNAKFHDPVAYILCASLRTFNNHERRSSMLLKISTSLM